MTDAPPLVLRRAETEDIDTLARLNIELLEDETNRRVFSLRELRERHADWVRTRAWTQDLFERDGHVVGYIVHGPNLDPSDPDQPEIYVRQFCIDRRHRRGGLGTAAIALFLAERVRPGERVTLDVLESNPAGQAFWAAAGFTPYLHRMELFR